MANASASETVGNKGYVSSLHNIILCNAHIYLSPADTSGLKHEDITDDVNRVTHMQASNIGSYSTSAGMLGAVIAMTPGMKKR